MTRLWCGQCGKPCGRLDLRGGSWHYVGRSAWAKTDRFPANKLPILVALDDIETAVLAVTCSSGHWGVLNVDAARTAASERRDSLTVDSADQS